jgi:hypothetical protein
VVYTEAGGHVFRTVGGKDTFTENEEFYINVGLMTAELVYRGPNAEGMETLSVLYYSGN